MNKCVLGWLLMAVVLLVGCKSDDEETIDEPLVEIVTLNVDVVLPENIREQWQKATDWALENIAKAQQKLPRRVKLNLRYHNEDTIDLNELAYRLTHPEEGDDTCHAIIGPYHSDNAQTFLSHAAATRLPVVMPTCTSAELQRSNARNTYSWFLTESDITQCEIMMVTARNINASDVALIYSPDTYGRSFADWFGYYAAEQGVHIAGGMTAYKKGDDLTAFLQDVYQNAKGNVIRVLVALSDAADYKPVCNQIMGMWDFENNVLMRPICADTSYDLQVLSINDFIAFYMGITPVASKRYGFTQAYTGRFLEPPLNGEAQIYDALTLIALGAANRMAHPNSCVVLDKVVNKAGLTDYMRSLTASSAGVETKWDASGLALAFSELAAGSSIDISGASGPLCFDGETHTKVLNTTYMIWKIDLFSLFEEANPYLRVQPMIYLSTAGATGETSTTAIWQLEKSMEQVFDEESKTRVLPEVKDHWAVVISPSTTWDNYRHQADAFAMYQLLREYGYDDDHIVLIVEDNLAYAPENRNFAGQIFVERGDDSNDLSPLINIDVRKDAVVDYHFSQLCPADIGDILMGRQSERLPHVIHPDSASNVFVFWSGHGGSQGGPLWGNEDSKEYFGAERIQHIVSQMSAIATDHSPSGIHPRMYRRMMLAIETCYSGQWGEALLGLPDVLVLTAANAFETSKADMFDLRLGVYLSNAFARTFRTQVSRWSGIPFYNLYRELYKTTNGSHVMIYNHTQYGSVYTETMDDFFPD